MLTALWLVFGVVAIGIGIDELTRWHENRNRVDYLIDGDTWATNNGYQPANEHDALGYLFTTREFRDERTPIADSIDFDMWAGEMDGGAA